MGDGVRVVIITKTQLTRNGADFHRATTQLFTHAHYCMAVRLGAGKVLNNVRLGLDRNVHTRTRYNPHLAATGVFLRRWPTSELPASLGPSFSRCVSNINYLGLYLLTGSYDSSRAISWSRALEPLLQWQVQPCVSLFSRPIILSH